MTYRTDAAYAAAEVLHASRGPLHRLLWHSRRHDCPDCWCVVWPAIKEALPLRPPAGRSVRTVTVNVTADTSQFERELRRAADALREVRS